MLVIKTTLSEYEGKGIGLVAAEQIKKGDAIWKHDELFTKILTNDYVNSLPDSLQQFIYRYATRMPEEPSNWCLTLDNDRFMNHSDEPNVAFDTMHGYAIRDINIGEEITCDYTSIDVRPLEQMLGCCPYIEAQSK